MCSIPALVCTCLIIHLVTATRFIWSVLELRYQCYSWVFDTYELCYLHGKANNINLKKFANTDSDTCPRIPWGRKRIRTTDVRLLRSVSSTWVAFIIMWTPFVIVVLVDPGDWSGSLFAAAIKLAHCNNSINSIIYGATNPNFREDMWNSSSKLAV